MDKEELLTEIAATIHEYQKAREKADKIIQEYATRKTCLENCLKKYPPPAK